MTISFIKNLSTHWLSLRITRGMNVVGYNQMHSVMSVELPMHNESFLL